MKDEERVNVQSNMRLSQSISNLLNEKIQAQNQVANGQESSSYGAT